MRQDYAGNSTSDARNIGTLGDRILTFQDYVGIDDSNDYYRFTLDSTRNLRLSLSKLSANANLVLMDSTGRVLRSSTMTGNTAESINYDSLAAGTYYIWVAPFAGSTYYTLTASAFTPPSLSITPLSASKAEGNSASTPFTFTVARNGDLSGTSTVDYQLVHGTTNDADFSSPLAGTITFTAGQSLQTITFNVVGDPFVEANERFKVVLSNAHNGNITTSTAAGTILNDDLAPPDYAGNTLATARDIGILGSAIQRFSDYVDTADTNDYYRFTLDATRNLSLTLDGLSSNADLALLDSAGHVLRTRAAGGSVAENINYDGLVAGTYYIRVYSASSSFTHYTLSAKANTAAPTLSIAPLSASKAEGSGGTTPFTFTVTRSGNLSDISTVDYSLVHGSSDAADFSTPLGGTIHFGAGQSTQTITINVVGDQYIETDENFRVVLSNAKNGNITTSTATGTILNDDLAPPDYAGNTLATARDISSLSSTIQRFSDYVGRADTDDYYRFTLDTPRDLYLTLTGLSTANADLALLDSTGSVLLTATPYSNPGIGANISYDNLAAGTYYVRVYPSSGATNYTLTAFTAPSLSITPLSASKAEGNSASTQFTFTVTRSGDLYNASTVDYRLVHSTTNAADFSGRLEGSISFSMGQSTQIITVDVVGDQTAEANENFSVVLSNAVNGSITTSSTTATILNDDDGPIYPPAPPYIPPSLSIAPLSASQAEGGSNSTLFTFTVTRSGDLSRASTVDYSLVHGTTDRFDFNNSRSGTISFGVGQSTQTITVYVAGDKEIEADESFSVVLKNAVNGSIAQSTATSIILNDDAVPPDYAGNTLATARDIGVLGSTIQRFSDYVGALDTNDYYRFTLETTRDLHLTLNGLVRDIDMVLLSSTGNVLGIGSAPEFIYQDTALDYRNLTAGTYYVRVHPSSAFASDYTLSAATSTPVPPRLSIAPVSKIEGNSGTTAFTFTVTRGDFYSNLSGPSTVDYRLVHGTTNAADFSGPLSGTITFSTGQDTQTITINVVGDQSIEADETFGIELSDGVNTLFWGDTTTGTILNDDISVPDYAGNTLATARNIGALSSTPQIFTDYINTRADPNDYYRFTLDGTQSLYITLKDVSIPARIALLNEFGQVIKEGQYAYPGYEISSNSSKLAAGTYYLWVYPIQFNDALYHSNYKLSAAAYRSANVSANVSALSTPPSLSITPDSISKAEGNSSTTPFTFTVTRSGDLSGTSSATYKVVRDSTSYNDFRDLPESGYSYVDFAVGQSTKTITINVAGDETIEADERFSVQLIDAVNGNIVTSTATSIILNDDIAPPDYAGNTLATARDIGVLDGLLQRFTDSVSMADTDDYYRFTLDTPLDLHLTLNGLSAYSSLSLLNSTGTTFRSSSTENPALTYNNLAAGTYYAQVHYYSNSIANNYTLSATARTLPSLSITPQYANLVEGRSGSTPFTFTVTRSGNLDGISTVDYTLVHNTTDATDFSGALEGRISFGAGQSTQTITINVAGDQYIEADESFSVVLSNAVNGSITTRSATGTIKNSNPDLPDYAGNTLASARDIGSLGGTLQSFTDTVQLTPDPYDYYRFTLDTASNVHLTVRRVSNELGVNLALLDSTGKVLRANYPDADGVQSNDVFPKIFAPGVYYVRISSDIDSLSSQYTLGISSTDAVPARVNISPLSADKTEGNSGSTPFTFTVSRDDSRYSGSIAYVVQGAADANNAAATASDFVGNVLPSGTLNFAATETRKTLTLYVAGDTIAESNKRFSLTLGDSAVAYGIIQDDDTPISSSSADNFVFRTPAESSSTITDFSSAQGDKIQVVASNFGLTAGGTAVLQVGSSQPGAVGTGGQFLYASGTGQLWFDQDGTGSGQAVLLATLSNRPTLGASDIQLVSA